MNPSLKKWRKENVNRKNIGRYLLYAVGEILLSTFGVLIAVNINDKITSKTHQKSRCQYLDELTYTFSYDIRDVEENIAVFENWKPNFVRLMCLTPNWPLL